MTEPSNSQTFSDSARMRRWRRHRITLYLAQKPFFCCCCIVLGVRDARRAQRVFRLVAAVTRDW